MKIATKATQSSATFSECGLYRYTLARQWDDSDGLFGEPSKPPRLVNWLMLNPSTADATWNDPTLDRCERFAMSWGYDGFIVTNLFAFRATDPKDMKAASDPVGPENDAAIVKAALQAERTVCAWGTDGAFQGRAAYVVNLLRASGLELFCLKTTKDGHPGHPLYLKADLSPVEFRFIGPNTKEVGK